MSEVATTGDTARANDASLQDDEPPLGRVLGVELRPAPRQIDEGAGDEPRGGGSRRGHAAATQGPSDAAAGSNAAAQRGERAVLARMY